MNLIPEEWRRERMAQLAVKYGGKAALGRALGYKDGAFVRQMISGERPITEKTMEAVQRLPGASGWFFPPTKQTTSVIPLPTPIKPTLKLSLSVVAEHLAMLPAEQILSVVGLFEKLAYHPESSRAADALAAALRAGREGNADSGFG